MWEKKTNLRADILVVHAPESMKSQRFFVAIKIFGSGQLCWAKATGKGALPH
jgi:hypothetical protein